MNKIRRMINYAAHTGIVLQLSSVICHQAADWESDVSPQTIPVPYCAILDPYFQISEPYCAILGPYWGMVAVLKITQKALGPQGRFACEEPPFCVIFPWKKLRKCLVVSEIFCIFVPY